MSQCSLEALLTCLQDPTICGCVKTTAGLPQCIVCAGA